MSGADEMNEIERVQVSPAAEASFRLGLRGIFQEGAKTYLTGESARFFNSEFASEDDPKFIKATTALEDLFAAGEDPNLMERFERDWGEEGDKYRYILTQMKPKIEAKKAEI